MRNLGKANPRGYKMDHIMNALDAIQIESERIPGYKSFIGLNEVDWSHCKLISSENGTGPSVDLRSWRGITKWGEARIFRRQQIRGRRNIQMWRDQNFQRQRFHQKWTMCRSEVVVRNNEMWGGHNFRKRTNSRSSEYLNVARPEFRETNCDEMECAGDEFDLDNEKGCW